MLHFDGEDRLAPPSHPSSLDTPTNLSFLALVPPVASAPVPVPAPLVAAVLRARGETGAWIEELELGEASKRALRASFDAVIAWAIEHHDPEKGPFPWFVRAVFFKHVWADYLARVSAERRARELADQHEREAILGDGASDLARYLERWRAWVAKKAVNGASTFLECCPRTSQASSPFACCRLCAMAAGPSSMRASLVSRRRCASSARRRTSSAPQVRARRARALDPSRRDARGIHVAGAVLPVAPLSPTPEEILIEAARNRDLDQLPELIKKARAGLSKPQQRWLSALLLEARTEGAVNLARAAGNLGKDRASASRAADVLALRFAELGLDEVIGAPRTDRALRRRRRW